MIKKIKKILFNKGIKVKIMYKKFYDKCEINSKEILFQSYDGKSFSCNPYYMFLEICKSKNYDDYKKVIVLNNRIIDEVKNKIKKLGYKNVEFVIFNSKEYAQKLASTKFLINNSTFPTWYVKKAGQKYLNTWHGTPLKTLGRSIKDAKYEIGNTQRNFLMADFLLCPNNFTFEAIKKDYMLDNLFKGEYLLCGYPRNKIFHDLEMQKSIREELNLQNKKVIVFMPTWRGSLGNRKDDDQFIYIMHLLMELEKKLSDDYIILTKLHQLSSNMVNFRKFEKIFSFPDGYETYEVLSCADILITDYSSVFFDFANTNKKIILYAYDYDQYFEDRGMYLNYKDLPFPIVYNEIDLIREIENPVVTSYSRQMKKYILNDEKVDVLAICNLFIQNKKTPKIERILGLNYSNKKENVLIFTGSWAKNGITTALKNLLDSTSSDKNYYLLFLQKHCKQNYLDIEPYLDKFNYIPIQGGRVMSFTQYIYSYLYFKFNLPFLENKIGKIFDFERLRLFNNIKYDHVIHYSGYEKNIMHLFSKIDSQKIIYVHNDLFKESKTKNNIHIKSLRLAYDKFNKIVVIRDSQRNNIKSYLKEKDKNKIFLAHNINNYKKVITRSKENIEFQNTTYSNVEIEELNKILNNKNSVKFINVARFSPEKGLLRLISAFEKHCENCENSHLIIIGGYGIQFNEIKENVNNSSFSKRIILIKSIINPLPILKKSDAFVLSSFYEGLPMTIMEALILNKTVISTNIEGPREFLENDLGNLVDNSEEGLLKGMNDFYNGKLKKTKKFDAEEFDAKAIKEFENLLKLQ